MVSGLDFTNILQTAFPQTRADSETADERRDPSVANRLGSDRGIKS